MSEPIHWHDRPVEGVLAALGTDRVGLAADEAAQRLARVGPNRLTPPRPRGALARFAAQLANLLIYVLLAAAGVTALLGHWLDTAVILGVVAINAVIGFVQEGRAERALDAIRGMLAPQATVLRDGHRLTVPAETLVPGDVVLLQPGDRVPADIRLLHARSLRVEEAVLTGESVPVGKSPEPVATEAALGDRSSMAFAGTLVAAGQAAGVVVATGDATEVGRIGRLLATVEILETPLQRQMARFGRWLSLAILAVAAATFAAGVLLQGFSASEMFLAAVGLAVAAIPEGLPAIMTITLAIGVERMARRNAIIRRLPAVETLGSVSVICSDKTGTFTHNEMTVRSLVTSRHRLEVTGAGYAPEGELRLAGAAIAARQVQGLGLLGQGAVLCNDAELRRADGTWSIDGDPMEGALLVLGVKAGLEPGAQRVAWPRIDAIPFDSEHRFMATLHRDHEGHAVVYVKGAPERILAMCAMQRDGDVDRPLEADGWRERVEELAERGERVLALAFKAVPPEQRSLTFADVEQGLTLLGLLGLADPPRDAAIAAVRQCRQAGIRIKMITGDHVGTARAIAGQLGLENAQQALTGAELDRLDAEALRRRVGEVAVFARTSPEHKLRLVEALQAEGLVVAMTGDGVNDAPALKRADVGVAMGRKGADAAKEAAEMVLADDNFASIAHAVEEGRTVYDNLRKALAFILPTNGGEAFTIVAAVALGSLLPITPVQILWVNMVTAVTLALALAFEPAEADVMRRPPRRPDEPLLSAFLVWRIVLVSAVLVAGVFGVFRAALGAGADLDTARTAAVNTLVLFEVFYLFNVRRLRAPAWPGLWGTGSGACWLAVASVLAMQLAFTYLPPMQTLFRTRALGAADWLPILAVSASVFLVVEGEKLVWWPLRR